MVYLPLVSWLDAYAQSVATGSYGTWIDREQTAQRFVDALARGLSEEFNAEVSVGGVYTLGRMNNEDDGEMTVRTGSVALGYRGNLAEDARVFIEQWPGWFHPKEFVVLDTRRTDNWAQAVGLMSYGAYDQATKIEILKRYRLISLRRYRTYLRKECTGDRRTFELERDEIQQMKQAVWDTYFQPYP